MKAYKKDFYNTMYQEEKPEPGGEWLFHKLKHFEKHREEAVIELLQKKGDRLIDIACGEGTLIFKIADKFKESWGIDISKERIKRAELEKKQRNLKNVNFKIVDVDQGLPFKDMSFDVVTAVAALAYFFDPYFAVKEMNRILGKGGVLVIEVPNLAYLPRRIELFLGRQPWTSSGGGWDGGHLHYFTQGSLVDLIENSGFEIVKISGSGVFADLRNWYPSLLCGDLIVKAVKK